MSHRLLNKPLDLKQNNLPNNMAAIPFLQRSIFDTTPIVRTPLGSTSCDSFMVSDVEKSISAGITFNMTDSEIRNQKET